jgi:DNA-binding NarL/FixJ family response regulator
MHAAPRVTGMRLCGSCAGSASDRGPADSADEGGELAALTPREREVAALVAEGRTNRQIRAQLHLSEKMIEKRVSSPMAKLGVSSRTGIARLVEREGVGLGA